MSDKPSEHNILEWDARDQPPTEEQRKKLVRDTLRYASLFPPGPEQSQLRRIARSLTFFEECLHSDEDFANNPCFSLRPSVVGGPDRVVGICLPSALFVLHPAHRRMLSVLPLDASCAPRDRYIRSRRGAPCSRRGYKSRDPFA
jgi:hypothetical protein